MAEKSICRADGCVNAAVADDMRFCAGHLRALLFGEDRVKIPVPQCVVEGCKGKPRTRYAPYCHKHDGRVRRHGSYREKPRQEVLQHTHGYRLVMANGHPMARGAYRVYEHRMVYFDNHPEGPEDCHWCGKPLTWDTLQVDHLNAVRDDNRPENLVASCGNCNRDRAKPAAVRAHKKKARKYMVNGKWLSIDDAAKRLGIGRTSITSRLARGWPVERAFTEGRGKFGPHSKQGIANE